MRRPWRRGHPGDTRAAKADCLPAVVYVDRHPVPLGALPVSPKDPARATGKISPGQPELPHDEAMEPGILDPAELRQTLQ